MTTPILHLALDNALGGYGSGGVIIATGTGPLRYRASDVAGRRAALIEAAGENYSSNPDHPGTISPIFIGGVVGIGYNPLSGKSRAGSLRATASASSGVHNVSRRNNADSPISSGIVYHEAWIRGYSATGAGARINCGHYGPGIHNVLTNIVTLTSEWQKVSVSQAFAVTITQIDHFYHFTSPFAAGDWFEMDDSRITYDDASKYSSLIPERDNAFALLPGYAQVGSGDGVMFTRDVTTLAVPCATTPAHIFGRYSEDLGETWSTLEITGSGGSIGTYGTASHAASTLTIASSRSLLIRDLVVYGSLISGAERDDVISDIVGAFFTLSPEELYPLSIMSQENEVTSLSMLQSYSNKGDLSIIQAGE